MWSDGFQPESAKTTNDFESMQFFTLTPRAPRGKRTDMHTLPSALCFKKRTTTTFFLQLLSWIQELQAPWLRYYGKVTQLHESVRYLGIICNDYPYRCANTYLSQLGMWAHKWGHSYMYDSVTTLSFTKCELSIIHNVLTRSDCVRIEDCGKSQDWWCQGAATHTQV